MTHITNTINPQSAKAISRKWYLVDMKNQVLGRMAPHISSILQGKYKPTYAPYLDGGDYVVVINARDLKVTGKKQDTSSLIYFSGYPGGKREVTFKDMKERNPNEIVRYAVAGMLPKNKLRDRRLTRLYIFSDDRHPYSDRVSQSTSDVTSQ